MPASTMEISGTPTWMSAIHTYMRFAVQAAVLSACVLGPPQTNFASAQPNHKLSDFPGWQL